MRNLYPDIRTNQEWQLKVDDLHTLYVEESGSPTGVPVVVVHGGPGAGCSRHDRRFFDPERYRIILFDQRGAGRSTPHAELQDNTTAHLIADMEAIRTHLDIEKWVIFGGSWGSTLGLLYAQTHPERVLGMILRGIFLCRDADLQWFYQHGASRIFPDYWAEFTQAIPAEEQGDFISAYYRRLTGTNELAKMSAAKSWSVWEGRCATLRPNPDVVEFFGDPHVALAIARIEAHYFVNHAFIEPDQILRNAGVLQGIPAVAVHGRYDVVCPLDNATALAAAWPQLDLQIVRDAGHSAREPGIQDALVKATEDMLATLDEPAPSA